jgi:hypothetical protein
LLCLHQPLLVEQGGQAKFQLSLCQQGLGQMPNIAHLGLFEEIEGIDLLQLSFLVIVRSLLVKGDGGERTRRKKNVALLAWRASVGSGGLAEAASF